MSNQGQMCLGIGLVLALEFAAAGGAGSEVSNVLPQLPEGDGIAANYPGDEGIQQDPSVIFADNFEDCSSPADLRGKWEVLIHEANMRIAEEPENVHGGKRSLEFTVPQQREALAVGVDKKLAEEQDVLFLRWYSRFEKDFLVRRSSVHNGGSISARYNTPDGRATPGIPADGRNKFLVNYENENSTGESPGFLNVYCYHPEQGGRFGDHFYPSGTVVPGSEVRSGPASFGPGFVVRPDIVPERGRWYCYEYMVKANTPGKRDGRIALWLDGKLVADFPNMRLRDVDTLKIDRFGVGLFISRNSIRANTKWYDDVVAATSYIGPMKPPAR
jgi:hypothetical protein